MSHPRVLGALGLALVLPALALAYLQTESGFGRVLVPLASRLAPGSLEVASGRLGLGGSLRAKSLRFESDALGVRVAIEDVFVDVSLRSLLSGPGPQIDRLRLEGAEIEIASTEPGADAQKPEPEPEGHPEGRLLLPVSIAEAEIRELRLRLLEGQTAWAWLRSEELRASGLLPGETGHITWRASGHVAPPGEDLAYDAELELKAEVGRTSDGFLETWNASLIADVTGVPDTRHTRFSLDSTGSWPAAREITASTRLRAERQGDPLGEIDATVSSSTSSDGAGVVSASVALRSLDETFLNPILTPLRRGRIQRAEIAGSLDVTSDLPIDATRLPTRAKGEISIGRLDYRTLSISHARLGIDATPGKLTAELAPTRINRGRVSARVSLQASGAEERLELALSASALDLTAVSTAFREDLPASVEGILELSASVSSHAPAGTDLRETANGKVRTQLRSGRIQDFSLMSFLAEQSGVEAFEAIPVDAFDVDADVGIENGVAYFEEDTLKSTAAELVVNGTLALAGSADLTIEAFVGPRVTQTLQRLGIDAGGLEPYQRLAAVPVAVRVSGPLEDLSYGPTTPRTAKRVGKAAGSAGQQLDKAVRGVTQWFKRKP